MGVGSSIEKHIHKLNNKLNEKSGFIFYPIFLCIGILVFVNFTSSITYRVFDAEIYLTLHLLLEFTSSLIAFATFTAIYYSFDLFKSLKSIFIANVLFVVAFIDILHLMSYNGMPEFLTGNTPQKATTYWIIGRLLMSNRYISIRHLFT